MTKKKFLVLNLLALLLSFNACKTQTKTARTPNVFEKEILALEAKDKTETYSKDAVLFIGSSSIKFWKNIDKDLAPIPVIQRGFGGAKFADVLLYTPRLVYPHEFKAVAVFVANDIMGSPADKKPEEVETMFRYFVKQIRKKNKAAPIFFIALTPTPLRWQWWQSASKANDLIENYCKSQKGLHFIRTKDAYLGADGLPIKDYFLGDNLHQNEKGYAVWSAIIKKEISQVLDIK
jgi:lysophospholipase L1-like esterase